MKTQRERFEAVWYKQYSGQPIYAYRSDSDAFQWFQLGEASGMELAAQKCDETANAFKGIDKAISAMLKDLADEIRALLARGGESWLK